MNKYTFAVVITIVGLILVGCKGKSGNSSATPSSPSSTTTTTNQEKSGDVTTFAGLAGVQDNIDGIGSDARFSYLTSIAIDHNNNLYVGDEGNNTIRKITPAGNVSTLSQTLGAYSGLVFDQNGNLFLSSAGLGTIVKIDISGVMTTIASGFNAPVGVTIDPSGYIYAVDFNNRTIHIITAPETMTIFAGAIGVSDYIDGQGTNSRFYAPEYIASDSSGNIYVTDNDKIRKITPAGLVSTFAGGVTQGHADGTLANATFTSVKGIAFDSSGNMYVADNNGTLIRKITPIGIVTTIAGMAGITGDTNGNGTSARFNNIMGLAVSSDNYLFINDTGNNIIRKMKL